MNTTLETQKLYVLQALRALAAFIVMAGHVTHEALTISQKTGVDYGYIPYPNAVGVDIFFVISGFVIVYASRHLVGAQGAWRAFMWRRVIRIVPLYWFYSFLMIATIMVIPGAVDTIRFELWHVIKSLFFYPHMRPIGDAVRPFFALGWSLNYEMYFYLIFAGLLFFSSLRTVMFGLSAYLIVSVLAGLILPENFVAFGFWFDPYVLEFLAGAWIAYAYTQGWRLPSWTFYPLMGVAAVILVLLFFPVQNSVESQLMRFFVGIILVAGAALPKAVEAMNSPKILSALGDSSYSLYLSHSFTIGGMKVIWVMLGLTFNLWIYVGITVLACLVAGHISYLLIERPMLKYCQARIKTGNK